MTQPPGDDLVAAVRRAAHEAGSQASGSYVSRRSRGSRRAASEADLHSLVSGSYASRSTSRTGRSSKSAMAGMTLQEQQAHVQNAAMDKYVRNLEAEAKAAAIHNDHWKRRMTAGVHEERDEIFRQRELEKENLAQLRQQIEENKGRRAETRKEFIEAASSHAFPLFTETFISLDEVNEYRHQQKVTFREELDAQLKCINSMKNIEKHKEMVMAERKHKENVKSMSKGRHEERNRSRQLGQDLVKAWDRDLRLKSIKAAIESGKNMSKEHKPDKTMEPAAIGRTF